MPDGKMEEVRERARARRVKRNERKEKREKRDERREKRKEKVRDGLSRRRRIRSGGKKKMK